MFSFRKRTDKHALAVAMTGVNLGDRLLIVGTTDPSLAAAIASKVGFSGRACVLALDSREADGVRQAAARAGVLVEVETDGAGAPPFGDGAFNLIVIDNQTALLSTVGADRRRALLQQAYDALSPRGRLVAIGRSRPAGLAGLFKGSAGAADEAAVVRDTSAALQAAGFRAVRLLAERGGLSFIEGVR